MKYAENDVKVCRQGPTSASHFLQELLYTRIEKFKELTLNEPTLSSNRKAAKTGDIKRRLMNTN